MRVILHFYFHELFSLITVRRARPRNSASPARRVPVGTIARTSAAARLPVGSRVTHLTQRLRQKVFFPLCYQLFSFKLRVRRWGARNNHRARRACAQS